MCICQLGMAANRLSGPRRSHLGLMTVTVSIAGVGGEDLMLSPLAPGSADNDAGWHGACPF